MAPDDAFSEFGRLTREMLVLAQQENWGLLGQKEALRRQLLDQIRPDQADTVTVREIASINQAMLETLRRRREDLGQLLQAFEPDTAPGQ